MNLTKSPTFIQKVCKYEPFYTIFIEITMETADHCL